MRQDRLVETLVWAARFWGCNKRGVEVGNGQGAHYERDLFTGGILESLKSSSKVSKISRKWLDYPLLSTPWGLSRISKLSRSYSQKTPLSDPD